MQIDKLLPKPLAIGLSVVAGTLIALQSRVNGQLGVELANGLLAALISFGIGTILISMVLLSLRSQRGKLLGVIRAMADRSIPAWLLIGGIAGGFFVMMQGLVAPALGVTLFTLAIVSGQAVSALLLQRRVGLLHGHVLPLVSDYSYCVCTHRLVNYGAIRYLP